MFDGRQFYYFYYINVVVIHIFITFTTFCCTFSSYIHTVHFCCFILKYNSQFERFVWCCIQKTLWQSNCFARSTMWKLWRKKENVIHMKCISKWQTAARTHRISSNFHFFLSLSHSFPFVDEKTLARNLLSIKIYHPLSCRNGWWGEHMELSGTLLERENWLFVPADGYFKRRNLKPRAKKQQSEGE